LRSNISSTTDNNISIAYQLLWLQLQCCNLTALVVHTVF